MSLYEADAAVFAEDMRGCLIGAGNLVRAGDMRGYNSMARMYTIEYAMR